MTALLLGRCRGLGLAGATPRGGLLARRRSLRCPLLARRGGARRSRRVHEHHPALGLGDRTALLNAHDVADLVGVRLVMRRILLGAHDELLVDGVHDSPLDAHDYRLALHVADDHTLENSLRHYVMTP